MRHVPAPIAFIIPDEAPIVAIAGQAQLHAPPVNGADIVYVEPAHICGGGTSGESVLKTFTEVVTVQPP